jgi:hypothetical protein
VEELAEFRSSCPAEVPGIHGFGSRIKDVDGRDKPGHDRFYIYENTDPEKNGVSQTAPRA